MAESIFGMAPPPVTREELIRARRRAMFESNLAPYQADSSPRGSMARIGATLGTALGQALRPPRLSQKEERLLTVQDRAAELQKARTADPDYGDLDIEDKQLGLMEDYAQALAESGDTAQAAQIAVAASQRRIEKRKANLEIQKLEGDVDVQPVDYLLKVGNLRRASAGEYGAFVPRGETGYDFTSQSPQLVTGRINEEGLLEAEGGYTIDSYLSLEDYAKLKKEVTEAKKAEAGDESGPTKLFLRVVGESERKEQRGAQRAVFQQLDIMDGVADAFERYAKGGQDPASFLDGSGKIVDFTTNLKSTIKSLAGVSFNVPITDGDQVVASDAQTWQKKFGAFLENVVQLPAGMEATGPEAAKYRASVAELAYATARANEPGARQLSDHDYKNALTQIGANAADPEKLRQVVLSNLVRKMSTYEQDARTYGDIAEETGLSRDDGTALIYGRQARQNFTKRAKEVEERFERLAGVLTEAQIMRATAERTGGLPNAPQAEGGQPFSGAVPSAEDFSGLTDAQLDALIKRLEVE